MARRIRTAADDWCILLTDDAGDVKTFKYSASGGLATGRCAPAA